MATQATVEVKVNADRVGWVEPNPVEGQPPLDRTASRGEIVSMPADQADLKRRELVRVYYPEGGSPTGAYRLEPAVLDPEESSAERDAKARAAADRKIADLQAEIADLRDTAPPAPAVPTVAEALPVTLTPAQIGARELPALEVDSKSSAKSGSKSSKSE